MLSLKSIIIKISCIGIIAVFTQCATSQKIDKTAPVKISDAYYQNWMSGIKEGGQGLMVYLPVEETSEVKLNEIYFKGKKIKLVKKPNEAVYVGKYTYPNSEMDLIMSDDVRKEYQNKVPETEEKIPFELKDNECVISYTKGSNSGFFKMENLPERKVKGTPMQIQQ